MPSSRGALLPAAAARGGADEPPVGCRVLAGPVPEWADTPGPDRQPVPKGRQAVCS